MILPASCMRSTLSPELLNILRNAPSDSAPPSGPSMEKDTDPSPASSSNDLSQLSTDSAQPSSSSIDLLDLNKNLPSTPESAPNPNSDSIRPTSDYLNYDQNPAATAGPSSETVQNSHPDTSPSLESLWSSPPSTSPTNTSPPPTKSSAPLPPDSPPFPGSTLLPIEPLKLSQKCSQELTKLLSDIPATLSQEPVQNQYSAPTFPPSPQYLQKTDPVVSTDPSTLPSAALQPSLSPYQSLNSLSNLAMISSSTMNQQLNKLYDSPSPDANLKTLVPDSNDQSSATKPTLDKAFVDYLLTIPRNR